MSAKIKIGWIGLGNMGIPMVKNLVKNGFEVTVYNRSRAKSDALSAEIQVQVADTPAALVATSDVIFTMLSDDAAVKGIYEGPDSLLSVEPSGELIITDMSTVLPDTTRYLAALCAEKGIAYLDAPVSGSVKPAEDAQLVIMAGGDKTVYEKVKPAFDALGKLSVNLGENGKGNIAKLAINLFLGIVNQGLAEGVLLAEKNGIPAADLLPLINAGAIGSAITKIKTENIIHNNYKAAFALKLLNKDIRLAKENGMDTPLGTALNTTLEGAMDKGYGEEDMIAVLKYLSAK